MPPKVALAICLCCIVGLFVKDQSWRPRIHIGGWVPLVWVLIIASRPVALWFDRSLDMNNPETIMQGSPIDQLLYGGMIIAGILVLSSRRFQWSQFITQNKWLAFYFAYLALSVTWSDYTFIAFKRWIKDFGNVVLALVVVSERDPMASVKALLVRSSYVLVPLSVLLIRYFPDLSRYYDLTGAVSYSGVSTNKNMLGMTLTVLGLALLWAVADSLERRPWRRLELFAYGVLLVMIVWLLRVIDCATALLCINVSALGLLFLRASKVRRNIGAWLAVGGLAALLLVILDVKSTVLELLGRDPSLTGRHGIWEALLKEDVNPVLGSGMYSFWIGDKVGRLSAGYNFALNEAHNGYLDLYLNVGLVGLGLFIIVMASAIKRAIQELRCGGLDKGEGFRFVMLAVVLLYNWTEAVIHRFDLLWFGLLVVILVAASTRRVDRERDPVCVQA